MHSVNAAIRPDRDTLKVDRNMACRCCRLTRVPDDADILISGVVDDDMVDVLAPRSVLSQRRFAVPCRVMLAGSHRLHRPQNFDKMPLKVIDARAGRAGPVYPVLKRRICPAMGGQAVQQASAEEQAPKTSHSHKIMSLSIPPEIAAACPPEKRWDVPQSYLPQTPPAHSGALWAFPTSVGACCLSLMSVLTIVPIPPTDSLETIPRY